MNKIIKKSIFMLCLVTMLFITGCGGASYEKERWVFNELVTIDVNEEIDAEVLQMHLEDNGVTTVAELEAKLLSDSKSQGIYEDFYLYFKGKQAYFYSEMVEREAFYFYKEIDNKVVLALTEYQFEDPDTETNLNPEICPSFVVSEDGSTITFTYYHVYYFVTIKAVAE